MPVYHQMGHDSTNLLKVPELNGFKGAILSPLNLPESKMLSVVEDNKNKERTKHWGIFDGFFARAERSFNQTDNKLNRHLNYLSNATSRFHLYVFANADH